MREKSTETRMEVVRGARAGISFRATAADMQRAWREDADAERARWLAEEILSMLSVPDWSGIDVDAAFAPVALALEILAETGAPEIGVELAAVWRRGVRRSERTEGPPEIQRLERRVRAATLTATAMYLDGRLNGAATFFELGVRLVRTAAGGDGRLSETAACDPFGPVGRIYAEHLAVGIRIARVLRERLRAQRLDRLVADASAIARQIPRHGIGYEWLHPLVLALFFALAERRSLSDAGTIEWLAMMDRVLRRDDRLGIATRPLVDMELAYYQGDDVATKRHGIRAHQMMEEAGLDRQIAAIIARGWCKAC